MWYLYILKCADNTLYTGVTNDISRRLACHNAKKASKYTRARTPVTLIYKEPHRTKSRALKRESEIKRWPRQQKLRLSKAEGQTYIELLPTED